MGRRNLPSDFPYHQGLALTIREHIPPQPFGQPAFFDDAEPRPQARNPPGGPYRTPLEWCLDFPPVETESVEDPSVRILHVTDQIACAAERTAQVLRCYLDDAKDKTYIAKIFDAVYFWPDDGDYTLETDENYACEAAAYEDILDVGMEGRYTPHYYGSWTFDLPVPDSHSSLTRSVRMVLVEEITGYSMCQLILKFRISPENRLAILAKVFEIYSHLEFLNIVHSDLAPRNVMISGIDSDPSDENIMPRVTLIDFNHCALLRRNTSRYPMYNNPRPIDPKSYLSSSCLDRWRDWVPEPHRSNPAAWRGWVRNLWPDEDFSQPSRKSLRFSDRGDFVEVPPEPDQPHVRPAVSRQLKADGGQGHGGQSPC